MLTLSANPGGKINRSAFSARAKAELSCRRASSRLNAGSSTTIRISRVRGGMPPVVKNAATGSNTEPTNFHVNGGTPFGRGTPW